MPLLKTIALNLSYVIWRNKISQSTKQKIVRFQKWFGSGEGKIMITKIFYWENVKNKKNN